MTKLGFDPGYGRSSPQVCSLSYMATLGPRLRPLFYFYQICQMRDNETGQVHGKKNKVIMFFACFGESPPREDL